MADYFKPRRGTQAAAKEKLKDGKQLRTGELFFELEYAEGKTVKSGRIMIGDGRSNYAELVRNNRYVFNPDDYMGVNSKFTPTASTETTIDANITKINADNNIKDKMGATSEAFNIVKNTFASISSSLTTMTEDINNKPNKSDLIYATKIEPSGRLGVSRITFSNGTTTDYAPDSFPGFGYNAGDSKNAATSMYSYNSKNASTANYAVRALEDIDGNSITSTYSLKSHNHTTADITNFAKSIKAIKVNECCFANVSSNKIIDTNFNASTTAVIDNTLYFEALSPLFKGTCTIEEIDDFYVSIAAGDIIIRREYGSPTLPTDFYPMKSSSAIHFSSADIGHERTINFVDSGSNNIPSISFDYEIEIRENTKKPGTYAPIFVLKSTSTTSSTPAYIESVKYEISNVTYINRSIPTQS